MQDLELRRLQTDTFLEFVRLVAIEHQRMGVLFSEAGLEGITPAQSRALMVMFQARAPLTARELSRRLGLSEVTVGRFVKALAAGGWVARARSDKDRRAFLLQPTARAREALPRFIQLSNHMLDEIFVGFSGAEIASLSEVIARIRGNLEDAGA